MNTIQFSESFASNHLPSSILVRGTPRFVDAEIARLASTCGDETAWRATFAREGSTGAALVHGDFAVGLYDSQGNCFLAVDRLGVRTLCYRVIGNKLHFAERADTLAALLPVAPLDPQAILDYLYFHTIPSPRTIFRGVYRLPPGHCAWWRDASSNASADDRLQVAPYWVPCLSPEPEGSFAVLAERFRGLVRESVVRQLDGSRPACFLSGGTDSSTVAGMIGDVTGQPAASYSIGFEAEGYDEMAYARLAARAFGTEHHEYYVTPDDLMGSIPKVAVHHDQPFGNSSAVPVYHCALRAREDGVSRLLAGDGGDELFGGNSRYAKQRIFSWYRLLPQGLRSGLIEPLFERKMVNRLPLIKKAASYVEQAKVPMPDRLQMYNLLLRLGIGEVLQPEFVAQVDLNEPLAQQQQVWAAAHAAHELNRTLAYDWRYTLAESDLPKVRVSCELAGVSVGYPFLSDDLLDFSVRLPLTYKLRGLRLRWFFKEALRGFLPNEILVKQKHGFGLPFGVWLLRHSPLKAMVGESLRSLVSRGVIRGNFVEELLLNRLHEHPGYYGEMVWILMMLEQWMRVHAPDYSAIS